MKKSDNIPYPVMRQIKGNITLLQSAFFTMFSTVFGECLKPVFGECLKPEKKRSWYDLYLQV